MYTQKPNQAKWTGFNGEIYMAIYAKPPETMSKKQQFRLVVCECIFNRSYSVYGPGMHLILTKLHIAIRLMKLQVYAICLKDTHYDLE